MKLFQPIANCRFIGPSLAGVRVWPHGFGNGGAARVGGGKGTAGKVRRRRWGGGLGAGLSAGALCWLTIEHPRLVSDRILVIALVLYGSRALEKPVPVTSHLSFSISVGPGFRTTLHAGFQSTARLIRTLKILTTFLTSDGAPCDRGKGKVALDELSPYLSDAARASLLQLNSPI